MVGAEERLSMGAVFFEVAPYHEMSNFDFCLLSPRQKTKPRGKPSYLEIIIDRNVKKQIAKENPHIWRKSLPFFHKSDVHPFDAGLRNKINADSHGRIRRVHASILTANNTTLIGSLRNRIDRHTALDPIRWVFPQALGARGVYPLPSIRRMSTKAPVRLYKDTSKSTPEINWTFNLLLE